MPDINEIYSRTWAVTDEFVRFFVLEGDEKVLVIDSGVTTIGDGALKIAQSVVSSGKTIELINTHADGDHIAGNAAFEFAYMHADEGDNYRTHGNDGTITEVKDGDVINLGNRPLKIIHLPGHTPGSVAIFDVNSRTLFSGDTIQDSDIYMFGERRDINKYIESLEKIAPVRGAFHKIYPSHGSLTVDPEIINDLRNYAILIRDKNPMASFVDLFGMKVFLHKFDKAGFFCSIPYDKAVTTEVMRKSDAWTIEHLTPSKDLMHKAGEAIVVETINAKKDLKMGDKVAVVCGKGNNAGDGFVVASKMFYQGYDVDLYLIYPESFSEDGKFYFDNCVKAGIVPKVFDENTKLEGYSVVFDCIFGTGFRGKPEGIAKLAIEAINKSGAFITSADINSGINGDTGEGVVYVKSDLTVSIGAFKVGHFKGDSLNAMRNITNADIGIEIGAYENE